MRRAVFYLAIDGVDVTSRFDPRLMSLTIRDGDGGKSDTLEAALDDADGLIELPRTGASVQAGLGWDDSGAVVNFEGVTDDPSSEGGRDGGMTLSISAKSADPKGNGKATREKHKDDASFGDVAKEWGSAEGLTVTVEGSLAGLQRPYWSMATESFLQWGHRIAVEVGATFKVIGSRAAFVPRAGGVSASGKPLPTILATRPGNIISWRLGPNQGRAQYKKFVRRWYDTKEAKWKTEETEISGDASAPLIGRWSHGGSDQAKAQSKSDAAESERGKGGGSVTIDGEPTALSQCPCIVSGTRPGIDGAYRVETATHRLSRGGGYVTELDLTQPDGDAGKDSRSNTGG